MCAGMATVIAIISVKKIPISTNLVLRTCCPSVSLFPSRSGPVVLAPGAARSASACTGRQTNKCRAASTCTAVRQPQLAMSQAIRGMNTVLARPPRKVMVMMARRKSLG